MILRTPQIHCRLNQGTEQLVGWGWGGRALGSRKPSGVSPEGLLHPVPLLPVLWTEILSTLNRTDVGSLLVWNCCASGSSQAGCSHLQDDPSGGNMVEQMRVSLHLQPQLNPQLPVFQFFSCNQHVISTSGTNWKRSDLGLFFLVL